MTRRSLTFSATRATKFNRTQVTGNQTTATIAVWVKLPATVSTENAIIACTSSGSYSSIFSVSSSNNALAFSIPSITFNFQSNQVIPNDQQWHHIVFAVDTTQVAAANRLKFYIDGNLCTPNVSFNAAPVQNELVFRGGPWTIGTDQYGSGGFYFLNNGTKLDELYFVDGLQLTPSAFASGTPLGTLAYSGAFGTKGFYLSFDDNSSVAAFGADQSGQSNNWTPVNFATTDSSTDVPPFAGVVLVPINLAVSAPVLATQQISKESFSVLPLTVGSPVLTQPTITQIGISRFTAASFSSRNPDLGPPHLLAYSVTTLGSNWIKTTNAIIGGKFRDAHWSTYNAVALTDKAGTTGPFEISQTITRAAVPSIYRLSFEVAATEARSLFEIGLTDNLGGTAAAVFDSETGHCFSRTSTLQNFKVLDFASEPMTENFQRVVLLAEVRDQPTLKAFIRLVNAGYSAAYVGNGFGSILVAYPLLFEGNDDRTFRWEIGKPEMRFYWTVHLHDIGLQWFRCSEAQLGVDPHLRFQTAADVQCVLNRWQPAQTQIVFDYSGAKLSGESDPMAGTP